MGVQIDLKAAFDPVLHARLIQKLLIMGVPNSIVKWIQSFLSESSVEIVVGMETITHQISWGTPQGSPLSLLLFI